MNPEAPDKPLSIEEQSATVGIFGGSFNPPHIAHVLVAAWALGGGEVDRIWIIPTGGHPFGKDLAPFDDRMEMCRRAFACFGPRAEVLDVEREPRTHYSIDTVRRLAEQNPQLRWRWIMGSDTLGDAPRWRGYADLMRLAPPLMIPRAGHAEKYSPSTAPTPSAAQTATPQFALPDLSSTLIRERLAARRYSDVQGLLPAPVLDWIISHGLYQPQ